MPQGEVNPSCAQRIAAEDRNKLEQDELKLKKLKKDGNRDELKKRTREGDAGGGAGRVPREIARVGPPERMASKHRKTRKKRAAASANTAARYTPTTSSAAHAARLAAATSRVNCRLVRNALGTRQ